MTRADSDTGLRGRNHEAEGRTIPRLRPVVWWK